jgi:two-component system nitrogen regulation response regulator GlnG
VLARHFVERYAEELATGPRYLPDSTLARLDRYDWPGNVRELENAIKRALVLCHGDVLGSEDFAFLEGTGAGAAGGASLEERVREEVEAALSEGERGDLYRRVIERVERPLIEAALARTDGNQIRAAGLLGINRNTLRKKIAELAIRVPGRE